jgi:hypothetical protein
MDLLRNKRQPLKLLHITKLGMQIVQFSCALHSYQTMLSNKQITPMELQPYLIAHEKSKENNTGTLSNQ